MMAHLVILPLFSLLFSVTFAAEAQFASCLSSKLTASTNLSDFVYTPKTPSYSPILQSSMQNLRFNTSSTPKPQFLITPRNVSHIQATIVCAKQYGLQVRVRSGGHDYEGLSYTANSPFVLIDLVNFQQVKVDVKNKTAWVDSGAIVGEVYYQIANKTDTLAFPSTICPTVGIGGAVSGGGQGTLMRKFGLSADNVLDAVVVDANGKVLNRESMGEDLFWAIRGGGGANFGVIVSWLVRLVPVPPKVTVFNVARTLEQNATQLVRRWQEVADKLDENLFIRVVIAGGKNSKGEKTVVAMFQSLYLGTTEELIPLMKSGFPELGLNASDCIEMSWIYSALYFDVGKQSDEPIDALRDRNRNKKGLFKGKSDFVETPILEDELEQVWKVQKQGDAGVMIWDPYGAKMSETPDDETPFPHRNGTLYNVQYFSKWSDANATTTRLAQIKNLYDAMGPFVSKNPRGAYLNYKDLDLGMKKDGNPTYEEAEVWGSQYFKNNFKRLAQVKAKVDPQNFFKNEQGIPPLFT